MSRSEAPPAAPLDLRLVPAAVTAWAAMWLIIATPLGLRCAVPAAALAGLVAARRRSAPLALVAVTLAATALIGGLRLALLETGPVPRLAQDEAVAVVALRVDSVTLVGQTPTVLVRGRLTQITARGQPYVTNLPVLLFETTDRADWEALTPGDHVTFTARLSPADRTDAAAAVLNPLTAPAVTSPSTGWRKAVETVRQHLRDAVQGARPEQAALLPALVVGDTSAMPAGLKADFKTTGLTHLTAVSGANLTILLAFLLGAARAVGVRGRALDALALAGVVGFVALCHSEPSVLRAAAMGLVGLAALSHSARPGMGLRHLALAVVALTWLDPWLSHSAGFALSVLACAGILLWGRPWTEALARWLPRWAAEAVAIPLAAQLATQPLVSGLSGAVSLAGLAANALAGPFVAPATVGGLVTALAATLHTGLGAAVGRLAAWLVEPILQIAHRAAALPGAAHPWPADALGLAALSGVCLVLAWLAPRLLPHPVLASATAAVLVAGLAAPPFQPGWPPTGWAIAACDVGQGDAVVVRVADHQVLLLDTGPPDAGLTTCLRSLDVTSVPLVVLSHLHADHAGGLDEVLAAYPVGAVLVGPGLDTADELAGARQRDVDILVAADGTTYTLGEATVEVLYAPTLTLLPTAADDGESSAENDASVVVRVTSGDLSILATGDLETTGQAIAVARHPDLKADILKVPHHGSSRQDQAFLAAADATVALISVGANNTYGHPAASTVTTLQQLGLTVVRTDEMGAIAFTTNDGALTITTQR